MNITGFTTDNTVSTGSVAQLDFKRYGRIGLTFHIHSGFIGLSIAGFETNHKFYLKPVKNQLITNRLFYETYVRKFNNKEIFDNIIKDFVGCL